MIFEKRCGAVTVTVSDGEPNWASIEHGSGKLRGLHMEDLRDIRHLIDRALAAERKK